MRFAIIKDKSVINVVEAPQGWTSSNADTTTIQSDTAGIGYSYDGTTFTAPPQAPPTVAELVARAKLDQQKLLAAGQTFNVGTSDKPMTVLCDGLSTTRADLSLLALYGQQNPAGSQTWIDNNGVATVLTGTELVTLTTLVGQWIADSYPALTTLLGDITAATPSITTFAQIDAFAWPTS